MTSNPVEPSRRRRSLGLLVALTALFSVLALLAASSAFADEETNCAEPGSLQKFNKVEAFYENEGESATYYFKSVNENVVEGVPGLKDYCVIPGTLPSSVEVNHDAVENGEGGAIGWNGGLWTDPGHANGFSFNEPNGSGEKGNIPFDGTLRTMGKATWSGGETPEPQTIILHIGDPAGCEELGLNSPTCFVLPGKIEEIHPAADLEAEKTAEPFFKRTFEWEIEKEADKTEVNIPEGGAAEVNYTVTVRHSEGTDSGWAVSGEILVHNPNKGAVEEVDIADQIEAEGEADANATCEVVGGGENLTIPAEAIEGYEYSCEYSGPPAAEAEENIATISWPEQEFEAGGEKFKLDEGSTEAKKSFEWKTPSEILGGEVNVEDSLQGPLGTGTLTWEDESPTTFKYTEKFEEDPAGTCTKHPNTASVVNGEEVEDEASWEVDVCVGKDLEAEKTATPFFKRIFEWEIEKEGDQTEVNVPEREPAVVNYTVTVRHSNGTDSGWKVTGKIKVKNPNDWESITAHISDEIEGQTGATCTVEGEEEFEATIPKGETEEFAYECNYGEAPAEAEQTNVATVTWDAEEASTPDSSATAEKSFEWGEPNEIIGGEVDVEDSLHGPLGSGTLNLEDENPTIFKYTEEFNDPAGTCTKHPNTASVINGEEVEDEASWEVDVCVGKDVEVSKTASPSFNRKYPWEIEKTVDKESVTGQEGGSATFNYKVIVTKGAAEDGGWVTTGKIAVTNPNDWEAITVNVSDEIEGDSNATCTVEGEAEKVAEIEAGETGEFDYECQWGAAPASEEETNVATATWSPEAAHTPSGSAEGTAAVDWAGTKPTTEDECVKVIDTVDGGESVELSESLCSSGEFPFEVSYKIGSGCETHTNVAKFITNDSGSEGEAERKVEVCGFAKSGALTMGFWQNKNGQGIIKNSHETAKVCDLAGWLRQYAPFQDLGASANCSTVATYVYNVIKAANAGGAAMNAMLKGQMLATALDVYFSNPALGGNKIKAPAPIGGFVVDLTKVCKNIPTCTVFENTSSAFGGATSLTVSQILAYAASKSNAGGSVWYGQVKATQELAKDTFDAINNQVAFGP